MSTTILHPLLRYSQRDIVPGHCSTILWDLREPPVPSARHVVALEQGLSERELSQPATSPPVNQLHIICGILPGDWPIEASNSQGVTVRDVLEAIFSTLQAQIKQEEWDMLSPKQRDRTSQVFDARWRVSAHPQIAHFAGVLRVDCLLQHTWFAGLSVSLEADDSCLLTLRRPK